jgi:RimJ/RimL family protein N-acetyltransferase
MELKTERLVIRELFMKDKPELVRLINDLDVSQYLEKVPYPYNDRDGEWFISKCNKDAEKDPRENYELAIEYEGKLIGLIGLTNVDMFHETATLGYWLGKGNWRKGFMYEASKEMVRFGFEDLGLRRIDVEADVDNEGSNALIKKLGAEFEGTRKEYRKSKSTDKIANRHVYGLLNKK